MCIYILADIGNLQGMDQQLRIPPPVTPQEPNLLEQRFRKFQSILSHDFAPAAPLPNLVPSDATPAPYACALIWSWMCICILADIGNLQGMEQQLRTPPVTPQEPNLLEQCFRKFQSILSHAFAPVAPLTNLVPSDATPAPSIMSPFLQIRSAMQHQAPARQRMQFVPPRLRLPRDASHKETSHHFSPLLGVTAAVRALLYNPSNLAPFW